MEAIAVSSLPLVMQYFQWCFIAVGTTFGVTGAIVQLRHIRRQTRGRRWDNLLRIIEETHDVGFNRETRDSRYTEYIKLLDRHE